MENNKNNKIIFILLVLIIIILSTLCILFASGIVSFNNINNKPSEDINQLNDKEYKLYDEVTLSDGSKWLVLEDSSKDSDYVTLIKKDYEAVTDTVYNEIVNQKVTYQNSSLKKYLEAMINTIPVTLKEIDGYKIRLLTVDDIYKIDKNWTYDEKNDTYMYNGSKTNISKFQNFTSLTMTETKCSEGKCASFYLWTTSEVLSGEDTIESISSIDRWYLGIPSIRPVINVYKNSL